MSDLNMLAVTRGKERSEAGWGSLPAALPAAARKAGGHPPSADLPVVQFLLDPFVDRHLVASRCEAGLGHATHELATEARDERLQARVADPVDPLIGIAAQLAGMSRVEFLLSLSKFRVSPFSHTPDELARDVAIA